MSSLCGGVDTYQYGYFSSHAVIYFNRKASLRDEITHSVALRMTYFLWKDMNVPASTQVVSELIRLTTTSLLFISCITVVS